jgi:Ser-tRNA(Ala) deacylase AlaX
MMQIEGFNAMPDGGTQVRNVNEIGKIEITSISSGNGKTTVKYRVQK